MAAQKGLAFNVEVASEVPTLIYSDEQRLQQILRNLLSNAVKFTHIGGVTLRVSPAGDRRFTGPLRDEDSVLAFAVADTGIGIAADKLDLIFGAFQQADGTTSRGYGGTGLGLSISRDIARLLGGEIHATSAPGRGSTFTFYLPDRQVAESVPLSGGWEETQRFSRTNSGRSHPSPLSSPVLTRASADLADAWPADAPDAEPGPREPQADDRPLDPTERITGANQFPTRDQGEFPLATTAGFASETDLPNFSDISDTDELAVDDDPLNGAKILIVDDDVRNVFALTSVFERYGAQVRYAENGRQGMEILDREDDVALVLMDVMMPELDGYATTAAIRQRPEFADLPIITVTAKAMKGDRAKSLAAGASEYVTKPVDIAHLISLMRSWLERRQRAEGSG
jgi:CheY-like chemotaxis protein